jgi:diacylglycerol kinase (ATP)
MKTCIILNPNAGSATPAPILHEAVANRPEMVVRETTKAQQAREFAAQALQEGYELIVAAGGDGTINEVVNGLAADFTRARLGILPLGTGNDLASTLAIPTDPREALQLLDIGRERALDLVTVQVSTQVTYCLNIAAGGFTGQMNEVLTDEMKASWGPLAYLISAATVLPNLTDYQTTISWDNGPAENIDALNVIVANGRTAAGGFRVAPRANPEDGLLDVIVVRSGSLLDLAKVAAQLVAGSYLDNDSVLYRQAERVAIASRPGMWFNVDGELLTKDPLTFAVHPRALRVIVGQEYTPQSDLPDENRSA